MGKWKLYIPILLIFVCLLLFLGCNLGWFGVSFLEITPANLQFWDEAHDLALVPYYDEAEDAYFLFLPACTSPSDLSVTNPITGIPVSFSLIDVYQGAAKAAPCRAIELTSGGRTYCVELWQCDSLPTVFLQGKNEMLSKVHESKDNKVNTSVKILDESGDLMLQNTAVLSGRGHGTWTGFLNRKQAKRPYNLAFSEPVSFGSFADIQKFCLLAEYSDESKLRNGLVLHAARELEFPYATPFMYVNLYVNGEYLGLYGIATKEEYKKHIEADQIWSVFEISAGETESSFYSQYYERLIDVIYGDLDYTRSVVNRFEQALKQQDWEGCATVMDMDSMALMYTLDEFFANMELPYASKYFYIDHNERIHPMLPWDFDHTLGNTFNFFDDQQANTLLAYPNSYSNAWYYALMKLDGFSSLAADALEKSYTETFLKELDGYLSETIPVLDSSYRCDKRRWQSFPPYVDCPIFSGLTELSEFSRFFSDYTRKRQSFLSRYLSDPDAYCYLSFTTQAGYLYTCIPVPKGEKIADYVDGSALLDRIRPQTTVSWRTTSGKSLDTFLLAEEDLTFCVPWDAFPQPDP